MNLFYYQVLKYYKSWRQQLTKQKLYHPLRKLSKLEKPDLRNTAGEVGTNS